MEEDIFVNILFTNLQLITISEIEIEEFLNSLKYFY